MDAQLKLKAKVNVIGSASDFTYKWAINGGLAEDDAARLSLAVTEVITNIVQYAYPHEEGELEISYHQDLTQAEIVIHEFGEPFDPDRHKYDRKRALTMGDFEGAGLAIAEHMVDNFMFLHTGKSGKEFRLVKNIPAEHIADTMSLGEFKIPRAPDVTEEYHLSVATPDDAEDIAKLIYRTYGYTYAKDDIYFPKKNELALAGDDKFAVMVRTSSGDAVGHFAVIRSPDSNIGEVGEVVVSAAHRRRGLMTQMLNALIGLARKKGMSGLFGEAVTVHQISQNVNHKLGFHSTALLLADFPVTKYRDLVEGYAQDVSVVIDFLLLDDVRSREVYLPQKYKNIITRIYGRQGIDVTEKRAGRTGRGRSTRARRTEQTEFDLTIRYDNKTATVVIKDYGTDLDDLIARLSVSLREEGLNSIFFDLPLDHPGTASALKPFEKHQYLFAGLMPLFHNERDYLRMQHNTSDLDMDLIQTYSDMARKIKRRVEKERRWTMNSNNATSASG
jgi:anti-sigma regulatory factor (Ser/Thr protein kinase)/N-acetylglutamate synthase-like GNAT family acetyltransferase